MPKKLSDEDGIEKKRRKRTAFSPDQQSSLESAFEKEHWPSRVKKQKLADELGMSIQLVRTWFQNRRAKEKREEDIREGLKCKKLGKTTPKKIEDRARPSVKMKSTSLARSLSPLASTSTSASSQFSGHMTRSKGKYEKKTRLEDHGTDPRASTTESELSERTSEDDGEEDDEDQEDEEEESVEVEKSSAAEQSSESELEVNKSVVKESESTPTFPGCVKSNLSEVGLRFCQVLEDVN